MTQTWQPRVLREVLAVSVAARGTHDALVTDSARLSWTELHAKSLEAARALHALGVRPGEHIGILMGNNVAWVTLFFGAAMIGAVTVPVNTRFKAAELAFCLKQADVGVLFMAERFLNIDFMSFLREVEPAVDHALPGQALPLLRQVVAMGEVVPPGAIAMPRVADPGRAHATSPRAGKAAVLQDPEADPRRR